MTIWDKYTSEERSEYKNYLQMYGALSALFNQKASDTGAPYLDSKFQETIYARSFNSESVDIGNTPHDIKSVFNNQNVGIGIKTWLNSNSSYQKVMQLKAFKDDILPFNDPKLTEDLANKIAAIKNKKLKTDYIRLGLSSDKNIYHYVTRDAGKMVVQETSYPLVNMDKITPVKLTNTSFEFTDGYKDYKYTFGDSQVWMKFGKEMTDTHVLETLDVDIMPDPFLFLKNSFHSYQDKNGILVPQKSVERDYIYLPLYSDRSKTVPESSGINAWNGLPKTSGSQKSRPEGEAYIPIPSKVWQKYPYWVDPAVDMRQYKTYKNTTGKSSYPINLHLPDGQVFEALFAQSGFKGLQTNPQNILGKWILSVLGIDHPKRVQYDKPATDIVTMDVLRKAGVDSVKLWHEDPDNLQEVWIDFAEFGSFAKFIESD